MEQPPAAAGIVMANWYWKVVRQFVSERFGISLCLQQYCLNWLPHGWAVCLQAPQEDGCSRLMSPSGRLFVAEYAVLWEEAQRTGARILLLPTRPTSGRIAELRGKWVLKGKPASGGLEQPEVRGEGQLLFGGVPGDGRGGMDGTGGQQQQRDLGCLPARNLPRKASRAAAGHLGQCAGLTVGKRCGSTSGRLSWS